jgi:glyoxylase-like metal-dependent hydrolase (beta-lactamase superfamily II)
MRADQARIRGVKTFDVLQRELPLARERPPARLRREELGKAVVASRRTESTHDAIELLPEIVDTMQTSATSAPARTANVDARKPSRVHDFRQRLRPAVNELRAQLDWCAKPGVAAREHAAADSFARLDDDRLDTGVLKRTRGREPGGACTDDNHVDPIRHPHRMPRASTSMVESRRFHEVTMTALKGSALLLFVAALVSSTVPASAQAVLSGIWNPYRTHEDEQDRGPGPDLGDYLGLPINDAARLFADSWDASRLTLQEHQCRVHVAPYIYHGPLKLRIWEEKDPMTQQVIAIKQYISTYEQTRTIWMDGRPHPSAFAPHTFMGFSTGRWDGNVLTVTTTHLKQGWIRRNGVPESDQTTLYERFIRHGSVMTHVVIISDPVYLAEPMIRTTDFALAAEDDGSNWLWPCEYVEEISGRAKGDVPHHLPGENPFLDEFAKRTGAPAVAARGGPETMYPEYGKTLKAGNAAVSQVEAARVSQARNPDEGALEVVPVQGNVYLLAGGGGNVVVQVGQSGVVMVDAKSGTLTERMLAEIRRLSPTDKPVRYLLNTSADPDHAGGNESFAKALGSSANWRIINTPGASQTAVQIIAHDNVLSRLNRSPASAWPTETFVGDEKEFYFNGEPVFMYHVAAAHTDGDSLVFFRRSDIIATGDIFRTDSYPVIDLQRGGGIQGVIDGLNRVLDLAVPAHHEEGGTLIVPGHGRVCDEFDVLEYRDMVTIVRDRINAMVGKKMTLAQVRGARPTRDYDSRYGAATGAWTTDMFVEAVYRSVSR